MSGSKTFKHSIKVFTKLTYLIFILQYIMPSNVLTYLFITTYPWVFTYFLRIWKSSRLRPIFPDIWLILPGSDIMKLSNELVSLLFCKCLLKSYPHQKKKIKTFVCIEELLRAFCPKNFELERLGFWECQHLSWA